MNTSESLAASAEKPKGSRVVDAAPAPLALQLLPSAHSHREREQHSLQLATMMRSLVLDQRHPLALEIVGTRQQRRWLIRARTPQALAHVKTQLQARLPQARLLPLSGHDDPFHLSPMETVSAVELQAGQPSYLPLQDFRQRTAEDDPVLGLLGALDDLPSDLRAIVQIALVPAPSTWSHPYQRKALEHALEPERRLQRQSLPGPGAPSTGLLVLGAVFLAGLLVIKAHPTVLPRWVPPLLQALLAGHWHQVWFGPHRLEVLAAVGLLVLPLLLVWGWKRLHATPLYDMRSVAEHTSRSAFFVRFRLYVIGPVPRSAPSSDVDWRTRCSQFGRALRTLRSALQAWQWRQAASFGFRLMGRTTRVLCVLVTTEWQQRQTARFQRRRRRQVLARLLAATRQYHLPTGNYFTTTTLSSRRAVRLITGCWWKGIARSRHLIDGETLDALWHLPAPRLLPDFAHLTYRQSQSRLLPPSLEHAQAETPCIGFSEHAGHRVPFGFPAECFEHHMLIGGKSGEGKSTLMQHLVLRSLQRQSGLIVIDPHGDLVDQILGLVPAHRVDEVVLIDLSTTTFACGINPLDARMARGRDKMISDLIKIFSRLWTSWGSRMEIAYEYSLRTLYEANKRLCQQGKEDQQYTLLDIMALLTNESFCHALLQDIDDSFIRRWWRDYYDPLSSQMQRDRVDPVLSKVAKFESAIPRSIVGQSQCSLDFSTCIAQQQLILIKLAKGVIGEDIARILGATLLGFLTIALEEQGNLEGAARKQVPIFIDEFQTLDGVDWSTLAELRKYGATFFLATQSLAYLREKQILPLVLANVKQLAIFRMSAEDAQVLHPELDLEPEAIVHQETRTCALKLQSDGQHHPTFTCQVQFPPAGNPEHAQRIREQSQRRWMRPVSVISQELEARLAREIGMTPKEQLQTQPEPRPAGRAREEGGSRGRKANEKQSQRSRMHLAAAMSGEQTPPGEITPMNWQETVGSSGSEEREEEEAEEDPDA